MTLDNAVVSGYAGLLLTETYGDELPRQFCLRFLDGSTYYEDEDCPGWRGLLEKDLHILKTGCDHIHYWNVWEDVLEDAVYTDQTGRQYKLHFDDNDGCLYAVNKNVEISI